MTSTAGSVPARVVAILALIVVAGVGTGRAGGAQAPSSVLRLALLPQWTVQQHRVAGGQPSSTLLEAVETGVVDRTVFAWQRGVIQRQALVVAKPIRLLADPEASTLGGRGQFSLVGIRPPAGRAAWTEVEVSRTAPRADDVLLVEIGGERNTMTQVLETLLVTGLGPGLVEVPLARRALVPGAGVPVVVAPFEQPLPPALAQEFRETAGVGLLVVRSPLWDVRDGGLTPSGPADAVPFGGGDWREGDRVFLRIPAATLERGMPGLVLAWKDRILRPDPDGEFPRRSALPFPLVR
jgi:hypothetical protein